MNVKTEFLNVSTLEELSKSSIFSDFKCRLCQAHVDRAFLVLLVYSLVCVPIIS